MRYHKPRRNRFRSNDKGYRRNGVQDHFTANGLNDHQRKSFGRNGNNPEKLLEKYNSLAKEASSNGDEILSESYYQHAEHFLRVIENRNSYQNNSKLNSENPSVTKNTTEVTKNTTDKVVLKEQEKETQQTQDSDKV